jgi:hypothetical protein
VTDLGGGVYVEPDDPWEDLGYEPREDGPHEPPGDGQPVCPWCRHLGPHDPNTGRLGGILCGACGNHFTSAPGEYTAMEPRRRLWSEETGTTREPRR